MSNKNVIALIGLVCVLVFGWQVFASRSEGVPAGREEVVFWHFWGGADRPIVEEIVERFNDSQDRYWVRAIAMPGSNLDLKFFLSVAGGDPPDLLNQDDPIVADWGHRGVLTPFRRVSLRRGTEPTRRVALSGRSSIGELQRPALRFVQWAGYSCLVLQ